MKLAYACETVDIIHAEAFIAEREYHRSLIIAKSRKMHMYKMHDKFDYAINDLGKVRYGTYPRRTQEEMAHRDHQCRPLGNPGQIAQGVLHMNPGQ
jgi:hypothetical protein